MSTFLTGDTGLSVDEPQADPVTPDDVIELLDDPAFHALPAEQRQAKIDMVIPLAQEHLSQQEDYSPEVHQKFTKLATLARGASQPSTLGKAVNWTKSAAGALPSLGKDIAAGAGLAYDVVRHPLGGGGVDQELDSTGQAFANNAASWGATAVDTAKNYLNPKAYTLDKKLKALKDDMVTYGSQSGRFVVNGLTDAASFAERGKTAMAMTAAMDPARPSTMTVQFLPRMKL